MIPRYLMIQKLGLFNTVWALIVPGLVTGFSVYLARQFISDVPDSICEAAKIDGAGPFRIYLEYHPSQYPACHRIHRYFHSDDAVGMTI